MPRAEDRLDMIRDLAILRKVKIDEKKIATLKTNIKQLVDYRDLLAHGIWTKGPDDKWRVIKVGGNWPKNLDMPVRSRRIMPEALTVHIPGLRSIADGLEKTIKSIDQLGDSIPLQALPEEPLEQFARKDRNKGRNSLKPPRQPKS